MQESTFRTNSRPTQAAQTQEPQQLTKQKTLDIVTVTKIEIFSSFEKQKQKQERHHAKKQAGEKIDRINAGHYLALEIMP